MFNWDHWSLGVTFGIYPLPYMKLQYTACFMRAVVSCASGWL